MSKSYFGKCRICGKEGKLTFEHIPPQSSFNDKPIMMQGYEHLSEQSSPLYGKFMRSNRGFGSYTLCKDCNSSTGHNYGEAFKEFAKQGMNNLISSNLNPTLSHPFTIKPLNVLKQILSMFLSADSDFFFERRPEVADFILDKDLNYLSSDFRIYLYYNYSREKRMAGYCMVKDPNKPIYRWSEISFPPFGYFFTEKSPPADKSMLDITFFRSYSYDDEANVVLKIPFFEISGPIIGIYKK